MWYKVIVTILCDLLKIRNMNIKKQSKVKAHLLLSVRKNMKEYNWNSSAQGLYLYVSGSNHAIPFTCPKSKILCWLSIVQVIDTLTYSLIHIDPKHIQQCNINITISYRCKSYTHGPLVWDRKYNNTLQLNPNVYRTFIVRKRYYKEP